MYTTDINRLLTGKFGHSNWTAQMSTTNARAS